MSQLLINDGVNIISLQGIRYIRKINYAEMNYRISPGQDKLFGLEIQYKGNTLHCKYEGESERNEVFDTIYVKLTEKRKKENNG